ALGRNVPVGAPKERAAAEQQPLSPIAQPAENAIPPAPPAMPPPLLDRVSGDAAVTRELARLRREQRHLSVVRFDIEVVDRADQSEASPSDPVGSVIETLT